MKQPVTIKIKGLSTAPSNIAQEDGELAVCHNLVKQQGEMVAAFQPTAVKNIVGKVRVLYIHKTTEGSIYIWRLLGGAKRIKWSIKEGDVDSGEFLGDIVLSETDDDPEVTAVGNILVFLSAGSVRYFRYTNGTYKYLGNSLPQLPDITWALTKGNTYGATGEAFVYFENGSAFSTQKFKDEYNTGVYAAIAAAEAEAKKNNMFVYPFLVRYTWRLYDGTNAMASPAVLMLPCTSAKGLAIYQQDDKNSKIAIASVLFTYVLEYMIKSLPSEVTYFDEIIDGIDVFVSSPFAPYKYGDELTYGSSMYINTKNYWISPDVKSSEEVSGAHPSVSEYTVKTSHVFENGDSYTEMQPVTLISRKLSDSLESVYMFNVCEIKLKNLEVKTTYTKLPLKDGVLTTLESGVAITDDYLTNCTYNPSGVSVYNRRLMMYGGERLLRKPFLASSFIAGGNTNDNDLDIYVKIKKNDEEKWMKAAASCSGKGLSTDSLAWFFYPDPDAKRVVICQRNSTTQYWEYIFIDLTSHLTMGGAYWYLGDTYEKNGTSATAPDVEYISYLDITNASSFASQGSTSLSNEISPIVDSISINSDNVVRMSEVNDPFLFPSGLTCTTGNGKVIALAATTLPISEGQQGQFPVMAFTDEGIWALSISDTGSISATNPMLRDVLSDKKSICKMDDAVAYATNRGIMILSGKESTCISDELKGEFLNTTDLISFDKVSGINARPNSGSSLEWSAGSRIMYSQQLQRLYVVPNASWASSVALVYSLDTQAWSSMDWEYTDPVNNYPTTLVQKIGGSSTEVYDIGVEDYSNVPSTAILTRPMALTQATDMKTVDNLIVYGNLQIPKFSTTEKTSYVSGVDKTYESVDDANGYHTIVENSSDISMILYGSNNSMDISAWRIVSSSTTQYLHGRCGTPYKYYRLAIFSSTLDRGKSIMCGVAEVDSKYNNTIR